MPNPPEPSYSTYEEIEASLQSLKRELSLAGITNHRRVDFCIKGMQKLIQIKHGADISQSERTFFAILYEATELTEICGAYDQFGESVHRVSKKP